MTIAVSDANQYMHKENVFTTEDYLINTVERAVSNSQDVHVSLPDFGSMTILASKGIYLDNTKDLMSFCSAHVSEFKIKVLSEKELPEDVSNTRNIDELMWVAGFYASSGRLMDGCFRDDVVDLMHWPNFTRLPSTDNSMRLASLLSNYPTSITLACRFLGIDEKEAYQFYTAARCAGLAKAINRTAQEPKLKPHRNQALLGLLLHKITGI